MSNGQSRDVKNIIVIIDNTPVPSDLMVDAPEVSPETSKVEVTPGAGGGFEYQYTYNADGSVKLNLFKRDLFFTLEDKYNQRKTIEVLVKDLDTGRSYHDPEAKIGGVDSYTLGKTDGASVTILTPQLKFE